MGGHHSVCHSHVPVTDKKNPVYVGQTERGLLKVTVRFIASLEWLEKRSPLNLAWREAASGFSLAVEPLPLFQAKALLPLCFQKNRVAANSQYSLAFSEGSPLGGLGHAQKCRQQGSLGNVVT